jgi:hypothetical protein
MDAMKEDRRRARYPALGKSHTFGDRPGLLLVRYYAASLAVTPLTIQEISRCPPKKKLAGSGADQRAYAKRLSIEGETGSARRSVEPSVGSCELDQLGPRGCGGGLGLKIPGQVMPDTLAEGKRPSRLPAAPLVFRVEVERPSAACQA